MSRIVKRRPNLQTGQKRHQLVLHISGIGRAYDPGVGINMIPVRNCPIHQLSNQKTCHHDGLRHCDQKNVVANKIKLYGGKKNKLEK